MSNSTLPTEAKIVDWFFHPAKADESVKPPRPRRPYNAPMGSVQKSISFTFEFLAARPRPFSDGFLERPRTIHNAEGRLTVFWSMYEPREEKTRQTNDGPKTETIIYYYGFDAARRLTVGTVSSESYEDHSHTDYEWPDESDIPKLHKLKLLEKLQAFREQLSI